MHAVSQIEQKARNGSWYLFILQQSTTLFIAKPIAESIAFNCFYNYYLYIYYLPAV